MTRSLFPLTRTLRRTTLAAVLSAFSTAWAGSLLWAGDRLFATLPLTSPDALTVLVPITGTFADGGDISAEIAAPTLQRWCARPDVARIVLRLSSTGGSGVEAERIGRVLDVDCGGKEVIALIEHYCLSACCQLAVHADRIESSRYALVGGIGTVIEWTDRSEEDARRGRHRRQLASGNEKVAHVDAGPLTPAQQRNLQAAMYDGGREFVRQVRLFRGTRLTTGAPIAAGGVFAASRAREWGLVDGYATYEDLRARWPGDWISLSDADVGKAEPTSWLWKPWHCP